MASTRVIERIAYSRSSGWTGANPKPQLPIATDVIAVPARQRAVRVPEDLGVVVGVQVDEAGRHVHAAGVDDAVRVGCVDPTDGGDPAVADRHVGADAWRTGTVEDEAVLDHDVVAGHETP